MWISPGDDDWCSDLLWTWQHTSYFHSICVHGSSPPAEQTEAEPKIRTHSFAVQIKWKKFEIMNFHCVNCGIEVRS